MQKVKIVPVGTKTYQYQIFCPGCGYEHALSPKIHKLEGSVYHPTFYPSLLQLGDKRCHSFIKDGMIIFLKDCWHNLAGETVELPKIES